MSISSTGSVTAWIAQLRDGQETGLAKLHKRYWPCLVGLARQRLKGAPSRAADEQDVAQEAFWSFYRRLPAGDFLLTGRNDLLALLTHIVACKAVNQLQHEFGVKKRGEGRVRDETALEALADGSVDRHGLERAADSQPTPLEQALLSDCYQHFVSGLPDRLRPVAELYLSGCTHKEIGQRLDCVERTVERKLALILKKWREMAAESVSADASGPTP